MTQGTWAPQGAAAWRGGHCYLLEWGRHAPVHSPCDVCCPITAKGDMNRGSEAPALALEPPATTLHQGWAWGAVQCWAVQVTSYTQILPSAVQKVHLIHRQLPAAPVGGAARGGRSDPAPSPQLPTPRRAVPVVGQRCIEPAGRDGLEAGPVAVFLGPGRQQRGRCWGCLAALHRAGEATLAALTGGACRFAVPPKTRPPAPEGPPSPATASTG